MREGGEGSEGEDAPHTCMTTKTLLRTDGSYLIRLLLRDTSLNSSCERRRGYTHRPFLCLVK